MNAEEYGPKYQDHLIDQYKVAVEMADRVSQRRSQANHFFISVNTGLVGIAAITYSVAKDLPPLMLAVEGVLGILLCLSWIVTIRSYRQLNTGKFAIILRLEQALPAATYGDEWIVLGEGRDARKYRQLTNVEQLVPALFILPYLLIIAQAILLR